MMIEKLSARVSSCILTLVARLARPSWRRTMASLKIGKNHQGIVLAGQLVARWRGEGAARGIDSKQWRVRARLIVVISPEHG